MTTQNKPEMTDQPVGFRKLIGLVTRELKDDHAVLELTLAPEHLNSHGSVHGGIIATMIDHAGGVAGCYCEKSGKKKKAVTLSLTTSFLAPVSSGPITATGRKRSGGRRIFASTIEITDETGRLIAIGEGTYRYIDTWEMA
jgi:uncharacterized protein (TIGR00369 family)